MYIKKLELRDFRNYGALSLEFNKKINIFLGDNAQGKTNILEALYITSLGKSFRTNKDSEMVRFGADFATVKVLAEKDGEDLEVEMVLTDGSKGIKVDGVKLRKASELLENVYAVVFSPDDLKIVKEEPERRRRFIDMELCQIYPSYYVNLANYRKVLKQRNAVLKDVKFASLYGGDKMLPVWNENLADYGSKILFTRAAFIGKINEISSGLHGAITGGTEVLDVSYEPNIPLAETLEDQKAAFLQALEESYESDLRNGTTGRGPHKDDLKLCIGDVDIRHFGSQGQQRTAALALKLAELRLIKEETGEDAILLLDDVLSELDTTRQHFLISSLAEDVQLFITGAEFSPEVAKALPEGKTFYVKKKDGYGQVSDSK